MAIADIEANTHKVRKGPPCTVCEAISVIPEPEAQALVRLLSNQRLPYSVLEADLRSDGSLAEFGFDISAGTLSRHARGRCEARTKLR